MPSSTFTPQLRPLSIGEVLDAGFRLLRARFGTLVGCVLVAAFPLAVVRTIIIASTDPDYYDVNAVPQDDPDTSIIVGQLVALLVMGLGITLAVAACFRVISAAYLGEPVTVGASLAAAARSIPALFVAFLVLAPVLLFVLGLSRVLFVPIVLFAFLAVKWALTSPAIVAERVGPFRGMKRSWQLTRGNWWRSFGILLVLALMSLVIYAALIFALYASVSSLESISAPALATIDVAFILIVLVIIYPLSAAILSTLYYDLRVRNEGFDLQLLAQGVGADTSRFESAPERPSPSPPPAAVPPPSTGGGFAPPEGPSPTP